MPKNFDFKTFKKLLIQHGEETIQAFAKTPQNKEVYAFALDTHATYGDVNFKWNTLEGFAYTRTFDSYKHYTDDRLYGHRGLKYSVGDFRFEDARNDKLVKWALKYEETLDPLWETDEALALNMYNAFMALMVDVVEALKPSLAKLQLTDDFIAFFVEHDTDDMVHIPKTISPLQMDKTFPELRAYETYKASLASRTDEERAVFWCQALADFDAKIESETVQQMRRLSRYSHDAHDELVLLGKAAVPTLVTFLDKAISEQNTDLWTYQSPLCDIAKAEEKEIVRLQALYARQKRENPDVHSTENTLRVLHAIDPERFTR